MSGGGNPGGDDFPFGLLSLLLWQTGPTIRSNFRLQVPPNILGCRAAGSVPTIRASVSAASGRDGLLLDGLPGGNEEGESLCNSFRSGRPAGLWKASGFKCAGGFKWIGPLSGQREREETFLSPVSSVCLSVSRQPIN